MIVQIGNRIIERNDQFGKLRINGTMVDIWFEKDDKIDFISVDRESLKRILALEDHGSETSCIVTVNEHEIIIER